MTAFVRSCGVALVAAGLVGCAGSSVPTGPTLTEQEKQERLKQDRDQLMKEKQQSQPRR